MTIVPLNKVGIRCNSLRETRNFKYRFDNCEQKWGLTSVENFHIFFLLSCAISELEKCKQNWKKNNRNIAEYKNFTFLILNALKS